jgi:hypothetical protein
MFCLGIKDVSGPEGAREQIQLTEREPFLFRNYKDNREHLVKEGESLFNLAARYFDGIDNPAELWWIIADFQPDPILDPTIKLELGRTLIIPSVRTVEEVIFNEARRLEHA